MHQTFLFQTVRWSSESSLFFKYKGVNIDQKWPKHLAGESLTFTVAGMVPSGDEHPGRNWSWWLQKQNGVRCCHTLPEREVGSFQLCTHLCLCLIFVTAAHPVSHYSYGRWSLRRWLMIPVYLFKVMIFQFSTVNFHRGTSKNLEGLMPAETRTTLLQVEGCDGNNTLEKMQKSTPTKHETLENQNQKPFEYHNATMGMFNPMTRWTCLYSSYGIVSHGRLRDPLVSSHSYWKLPFIVDLPLQKWWSSIVMLVYQRVIPFNPTRIPLNPIKSH